MQRLILSFIFILILQQLSACGDAVDDASQPEPVPPSEPTAPADPADPSPPVVEPPPPVTPPPTVPPIPPITSPGWPVRMGANRTLDYASGIAIGAGGYLYITGVTRSDLLNNTRIASPNAQTFVMKMDVSGQVYWVTYFSATDGEVLANSIAVDVEGNSYFAGWTTGTVVVSETGGSQDIVFAKLDPGGNKIWVKQYGSTSGGANMVFGIAVDINQNIYTVGYSDKGLFGTIALSTDYLLAKFDINGDLIWFNLVDSVSSVLEISTDLSLDSNANIYITGRTDGVLAGTNSFGGSDIFIAKYSTTGELQWTQQVGSNVDDEGESISVNEMGYSCVAGATVGDFDGISKGLKDAVILYINPGGVLLGQMQYGGSGSDTIYDVVIGTEPNICYVVGTTGSNLTTVSLGGDDIFVAKLNLDQKSVIWEKHLGTDSDDNGFGLVLGEKAGFVAGSASEPLTANNTNPIGDVYISNIFP